MAIWQCDFYLVEKSVDNVLAGPVFSKVNQQSLSELEKSLQVGETWSKDIIIYGNNDQTCVQLLYENSKLQEVLVRLDLRTLNKELLMRILQFIKINKAKIYVNDKIMESNFKNIVEYIKSSNAYQFIENPLEFLDK